MTLFIKYKTILFLAFFCVGILTKSYFKPDITTYFILIIPLLLILIKYPALYFILFLPLGFFLTPNYSPNFDLEKYVGQKISVTGTLIKNPEQRANSIRLFLKLKKIKHGSEEISSDSKIVAYIENINFGLNYGDLVELKQIRLEKIKNYKNPGSFNIEKFYKRKNIFFTTYVENKKINFLGTNPDINPFLHKINYFRMQFSRFAESNTDYPESSIIKALTVGDKSNIPTQIRENFSGLGIAHIFAISGLHVGAIAIGFYFLIKWILKRSEYILLTYQMPRLAALLTIFPVFIYTAIAGFSISAVRAFIMISIYLLAIVLGKNDLKLNTLFLAGLIILLINPNSLFELSFQLSFLSVFGILLIHSFFPFEISTFFGKIKTATITTVAATMITLPLVINTFGYLPVLSVPANLLLIPFVEFAIVPLGIISLITFKIFPSLSSILLGINALVISILLNITDLIDSIGLATITAPKINFITTFFLFFTGVLILVRRHYKEVIYILPAAFLLLIISVINNFQNYSSGKLEINFLDSGKKNIALIKTPSSKTILISGGYSGKSKSDFIERSVINPFLLHNNITKIDHLVLTSLDLSHIKGATAILKKIEVKNIWINGYKLKSELWEQIYENNISLNKIEDNRSLKIDGLSISFLRPSSFTVYDSKYPPPLLVEINYDNSVFHMGGKLEYGQFNNIKSNIFYLTEDRKINPEYIIKNYGPEKLICRRCKKFFRDFKMNIYETELSGTVTVIVKNESINIREYIKQ